MAIFLEGNYNTVDVPPVLLATVKKGRACLLMAGVINKGSCSTWRMSVPAPHHGKDTSLSGPADTANGAASLCKHSDSPRDTGGWQSTWI